MQRLDGERHRDAARVTKQFGDAVLDLAPRSRDILRGDAAGSRELRQASDHENEAGRAEHLGLVDGPAIVLANLASERRVGCKHAAPAIAREFDPSVANGMRGAL